MKATCTKKNTGHVGIQQYSGNWKNIKDYCKGSASPGLYDIFQVFWSFPLIPYPLLQNFQSLTTSSLNSPFIIFCSPRLFCTRSKARRIGQSVGYSHHQKLSLIHSSVHSFIHSSSNRYLMIFLLLNRHYGMKESLSKLNHLGG